MKIFNEMKIIIQFFPQFVLTTYTKFFGIEIIKTMKFYVIFSMLKFYYIYLKLKFSCFYQTCIYAHIVCAISKNRIKIVKYFYSFNENGMFFDLM